MPVVKFIEVEALQVITNKAKPKNFSFGKCAINLKIGVDVDKDLVKVLDEDPLAFAKLQEAASSAYKDFIDSCAASVTKTDKTIGKLVGRPDMQQAAGDVCLAGIKMDAKKLEKDVETGVKKAWVQIGKTNTDYRTYKINAACSIGLKTGGIVISAVGIGGAVATGGLSAVLGLYGLIKSSIGLIKDLIKLALTAEKFRKAINKQVSTLVTTYKSQRTAIRNAKDIGKALVNQVFQAEFGTIKKCSSDVDQYLSKLDGMDVKSHQISRELGKVMSNMDATTRQLKAVTKNNKTLEKALDKLEKSVNSLITDIVAKQEVINEGRAWGERMKVALDLLEKGKPGWLRVFEGSFVLMDTALAFNDLSGSADKVLEIAGSAADAARELQGDVRDALSA